MDFNRPLPTSLKVVAGLFIFGGICSALEIVISLVNSHLNINLGVLGLFIGPGLLRLRHGWRTCALVFLWIALVGTPITTLLLLANPGPLEFKVFGQTVGETAKGFGLVVAAVVFLLALWQYRVLTRPDIRALFGLGNSQQFAAADLSGPGSSDPPPPSR